ncbi:MAG TPA: hypothetical protein DIU15_08985 [Deltaproteobacteria bacterium]|nr:hypothetical protein [Deltaproteobacteria bacterium]HCP46163.1 hypothetical protein [Deltaproteobacteria bacterium]
MARILHEPSRDRAGTSKATDHGRRIRASLQLMSPKAPAPGEPSPTGRALLLPSPLGLLWALLFALTAAGPATSALISGDGDFALHVQLGELMIDKGGFLATDPTSVTGSRTPLIAHEWGAQLLFGGLFRSLGLAGPVLLCAFLYATCLLVLGAGLRGLGTQPWTVLAVLSFPLLLSQAHLLARPHLISWVLGVTWYLLLERYRRNQLSYRAWLCTSLALAALWSNLHGGFLLAPLLCGVFALGAAVDSVRSDPSLQRVARRQALELGAALPLVLSSTALNPFGFELHQHLVQFLDEPVLTTFTPEFRPPDYTRLSGQLFLAQFVVAFGLAVITRRKLHTAHGLVLLCFLVLGLRSARQAVLFSFFAALVLGPAVEALLSDLARASSPLGRLFAAIQASNRRLAAIETRSSTALPVVLAGLAVCWTVGLRGQPPIQFDPAVMPVSATAHIQKHPDRYEGQMFNKYGWGGYLALTLYPQHMTWINGLNDHYGPQVASEYAAVRDLDDNWQEILDDQNIMWVIHGRRSPLSRALEESPLWEQSYVDSCASIFVRQP